MITLLAVLAMAAATQPPDAKSDFEKTPVPATATELDAVRKGLDDELADADSAKLKDFMVLHSPSGIADLCGMINAKNRFGAYVGYQKVEMLIMPTREGGIKAMPMSLDSRIAGPACRTKGM